MTVLLLILDSLGSTELLFILLMALVFFGPRKLPQLSRSLGKNLAEFRKASEDFKRTWEREVALESSEVESNIDQSTLTEGNSILEDRAASNVPPLVAAPGEQVIARRSNETIPSAESFGESTEASTSSAQQIEPPRKQDWL